MINVETMEDIIETEQNSKADYRIDKCQILLEIHANILMRKNIFPGKFMQN